MWVITAILGFNMMAFLPGGCMLTKVRGSFNPTIKKKSDSIIYCGPIMCQEICYVGGVKEENSKITSWGNNLIMKASGSLKNIQSSKCCTNILSHREHSSWRRGRGPYRMHESGPALWGIEIRAKIWKRREVDVPGRWKVLSKSQRREKDRFGDEDGQCGLRGMFTEGAVGG